MTARSPFKLNRWHVEILGVGLLVILSFAAFLLVIRPIAQATIVRDAAQTELADQRTLAAQIEDVREQLERQLALVQQAREASWVHLEPAKLLNARMAQIVDVAAAQNLVIDESWSREAESGEKFQSIPINPEGDGENLS